MSVQEPSARPAEPDAKLLYAAANAAIDHRAGIGERPVAAGTGPGCVAVLRALLGGDLPEAGCDPEEVVADLAGCTAHGVVASAGPRFFGYVVGGTHPVGLAADWLVSGYDQFAATFDAGPAVSVAEQVALGWVIDLLGLRGAGRDSGREISGGFTTGTTMAHVTALAAARHALLAARGWDVEAHGLRGAPPVTVLVGGQVHVSVLAALQYLGLGRAQALRMPTDDHGRMRADSLAATLSGHPHPVIVCAQAGEINTGAFDPFTEIAEITRPRGDWLHVDGAFGLWAAVAPELAHLIEGVALADSWATDAHKMLNVPYDCGVVLTAHPDAHRAAMATQAPYTTVGATGSTNGAAPYNGMDWVPEMARRARGVPVYAVLRALGRDGLAEMVTRCHRNALRMAERIDADPRASVPHQVSFNQVLIDCAPRGLDAPAAEWFVARVIDEVRAEGTCWVGGTTWRGRALLRVSVANWSTTAEDVDRSAAAILSCLGRVLAAPAGPAPRGAASP